MRFNPKTNFILWWSSWAEESFSLTFNHKNLTKNLSLKMLFNSTLPRLCWQLSTYMISALFTETWSLRTSLLTPKAISNWLTLDLASTRQVRIYSLTQCAEHLSTLRPRFSLTKVTIKILIGGRSESFFTRCSLERLHSTASLLKRYSKNLTLQ